MTAVLGLAVATGRDVAAASRWPWDADSIMTGRMRRRSEEKRGLDQSPYEGERQAERFGVSCSVAGV